MVCLAVNSPKQAAPDHAGRKCSTSDKQRNARNGYFRKNRSSRRGMQIYISCARRCANGKAQTLVTPLPKGDTQQKIKFHSQHPGVLPGLLCPRRRGPVPLLSFEHISHLVTGEAVKEALPGCCFTLSDHLTDIFDASAGTSPGFRSFAWWV